MISGQMIACVGVLYLTATWTLPTQVAGQWAGDHLTLPEQLLYANPVQCQCTGRSDQSMLADLKSERPTYRKKLTFCFAIFALFSDDVGQVLPYLIAFLACRYNSKGIEILQRQPDLPSSSPT